VIRFLVRRALWLALTLWVVATVSFFLMHAVRGGPFDGERRLNPAIERNVRARYHLNWPLWKQYLAYVGPLELGEHGAKIAGGDGTRTFGGVLAGDFGPSFKYRDFSVNDIVGASLPISIALGSLALCFALALGIAAGVLSAVRRGTRSDVALRVAATAGIAVPNFVIASLLVIALVFLVPMFPVAGYGSWRHLVLPSLALGAPFAAYVARLTRTGMLEALAQEHVRTARAKGLPEHLVVLRHALPQALLPVISFLGPAAAGILTGSLVVERVFAIPGCGSHFVNSALNRDYTLAMGVTILYTALVCALNALVDVAYTWIDPRIRVEES
jgi:oligopeptide transport system permease protein